MNQLAALNGPFAVGWHDRGHSHGDYGILNTEGELIAKVVSGRQDHAFVLAASALLLEGCKKALTCGSIDSNVRTFIESVVAEAKQGPISLRLLKNEAEKSP